MLFYFIHLYLMDYLLINYIYSVYIYIWFNKIEFNNQLIIFIIFCRNLYLIYNIIYPLLVLY